MPLNQKQIEQLLRPVHPRRVQRDRTGNSHLAGYDVSAHLTRIFGFGGWEKHIRSLDLVSEDSKTEGSRTGWWVTYRCLMTLDVKDPAGVVIWSGDDGATGSASNLPSRGDAHDFAVKNAITYALKRCAKDLGDQFGLSLYNKGSMDALVGRTLAMGEGSGDVESAIPGELHPDADDTPPGEEGTPAAGPVAPRVAEPAPARQRPTPKAQQDASPAPDEDPDWGVWTEVINEIKTMADAEKADADLAEVFTTGVLSPDKANAIRKAIRAKGRQVAGRQPVGASA